ncbi:MAG: transketolase C-terminal domain-containing protein, partial [Clostridia bacterium]|nr:transketolase C-terminal domain-containing protein [Clostridia bacterium]
VGAAATGLRPIIEIQYMDWMTQATDQIVNMAAKMRYMSAGKVSIPLVVRTTCGNGEGMAAQHSQCFVNWLNAVPGLKIVAPVTPYDAKGLLKAAIRDDNPVIFVEDRPSYPLKGEVPAEDYIVPIGKAAIRMQGADVTVVSYSMMAYKAEKAAQELLQAGISCEVIDLRSLLPLDYETVMKSIQKTGRVVVAQETSRRGGIASDIVAEIIDRGFHLLKAAPVRVGGLNVPMPFSKVLEETAVPDVQKIKSAIEMCVRGEKE